MTRSILSTVALLILNLGWLVPAWLSMRFLLDWCQLEVAPVVYGNAGNLNSFPFLSESRRMLAISCVWLSIAIAWNTLLAQRDRALLQVAVEKSE